MAALTMPPPGFDELSAEEQIDYVQMLWSRISAREDDVPTLDWQRELLVTRRQELENGDAGARNWSDFRVELQARLRDVRR